VKNQNSELKIQYYHFRLSVMNFIQFQIYNIPLLLLQSFYEPIIPTHRNPCHRNFARQ